MCILMLITAFVIISCRPGIFSAMRGIYFHTSTPTRVQNTNVVIGQQPYILASILSNIEVICNVRAAWLL